MACIGSSSTRKRKGFHPPAGLLALETDRPEVDVALLPESRPDPLGLVGKRRDPLIAQRCGIGLQPLQRRVRKGELRLGGRRDLREVHPTCQPHRDGSPLVGPLSDQRGGLQSKFGVGVLQYRQRCRDVLDQGEIVVDR
jgi:hypothetical protein